MLYPYIRKTIGWKLECELSNNSLMSRRDAYDNILTKKLDSQVPQIGLISKAYSVAALITFLVGLSIMLTVVIIRCCTEAKSTWYTTARKIMYYSLALALLATSILLGVVTVEYVMALDVTVNDHTFVTEDLTSI